MIFVTVGTHEQPFDRLVKEIDLLKKQKIIDEPVFIQLGYSTYKPTFCENAKFVSFKTMMQNISTARLVIAHGGPGTIMPVLYNNKVPIVVPRQKKFHEHVDNHQAIFCRKLEEKGKVIGVYEIKNLRDKIQNYEDIILNLEQKSSDKADSAQKIKDFATSLEKICLELLKK